MSYHFINDFGAEPFEHIFISTPSADQSIEITANQQHNYKSDQSASTTFQPKQQSCNTTFKYVGHNETKPSFEDFNSPCKMLSTPESTLQPNDDAYIEPTTSKVFDFIDTMFTPKFRTSLMSRFTEVNEDSTDTKNKKCTAKKIRLSELPIYPTEEQCKKTKKRIENKPAEVLKTEPEPEGMIKTILDASSEAWNQVVAFTDSLHSTVDKTSQRLNGIWNELIEKLREEDNAHLRYATIVTGGIAGVILARRGGKFKKTFYGSFGALSASAVCYPEKAKTTFRFARHSVIVAYYLINGYNLNEYYEKKRMKEMDIEDDDITKTDVDLNDLTQKLNNDSYFKEYINSVANKEVLSKRKHIGIIYEKKQVLRDAKNQ